MFLLAGIVDAHAFEVLARFAIRLVAGGNSVCHVLEEIFLLAKLCTFRGPLQPFAGVSHASWKNFRERWLVGFLPCPDGGNYLYEGGILPH